MILAFQHDTILFSPSTGAPRSEDVAEEMFQAAMQFLKLYRVLCLESVRHQGGVYLHITRKCKVICPAEFWSCEWAFLGPGKGEAFGWWSQSIMRPGYCSMDTSHVDRNTQDLLYNMGAMCALSVGGTFFWCATSPMLCARTWGDGAPGPSHQTV